MANSLHEPLTSAQKDMVGKLAAGLFPLDTWLHSPHKYQPPVPPLPWRTPGHPFTPDDLGVVEFFEALLRESSVDDDLFARWAALSVTPLGFSPLPGVQAWRANRGLTNPPKFGIAASSNVQIVGAQGNPISRQKFYGSCWPLLQAVVDARRQQGPIDWSALTGDLLANRDPHWPATQNPPSSAFLVQFTCDMLYAMLGMRNPVPPPWRYALLVELGEHRRAGQGYTPEDAQATVKAIRKLIARLQEQPAPVPAAPPAHIPPVGSPPHDRP